MAMLVTRKSDVSSNSPPKPAAVPEIWLSVTKQSRQRHKRRRVKGKHMTIIGIVFLVSAIAFMWLIITAPYGHEDDEGFHIDKE